MQLSGEGACLGDHTIRTPAEAGRLQSCGQLSDLDLRPIFRRLEEQVKTHVLICMLAAYLAWHLHRARAPLTFTDQNPPRPGQPGRWPDAR